MLLAVQSRLYQERAFYSMFDLKKFFPASDGSQDTLDEITKISISEAHERPSKRICFSVYPHSPKISNGSTTYGKINWPFSKGMDKLFPFDLLPNKFKPGHVWTPLSDEEEFLEASDWCSKRDQYVYLCDCMTCSAALGFNKPSNETPDYTLVGSLVSSAKEQPNKDATNQLVELVGEFLDLHAPFKKVDYVCAVPAPHKTYDLPRVLADAVSKKIKKPDITAHFSFQGQKQSAKKVKADDVEWFEKKWEIWEAAQVKYGGPSLKGKRVLIIDDNYQSGISIQFTGMKLQQAGATQIYSLCMTKTLGDRGN